MLCENRILILNCKKIITLYTEPNCRPSKISPCLFATAALLESFNLLRSSLAFFSAAASTVFKAKTKLEDYIYSYMSITIPLFFNKLTIDLLVSLLSIATHSELNSWVAL